MRANDDDNPDDPDGNDVPEEQKEHIAGPSCESPNGYSGYRTYPCLEPPRFLLLQTLTLPRHRRRRDGGETDHLQVRSHN